MGAPRRMMAVVAGLALAATTVSAVAAQDNRPDPPNAVVAAAWAAADDARTAAKALATVAEDDDTGEPQGRGSDAFNARHAALADRHLERPGNAWHVHDALSRSESPARLGREQAAAKRGLGHARQALGGDGDEHPGRGLGRDKAPGPPDHAGTDDDDPDEKD